MNVVILRKGNQKHGDNENVKMDCEKISKSVYFRDDFEKLMVMTNVQC